MEYSESDPMKWVSMVDHTVEYMKKTQEKHYQKLDDRISRLERSTSDQVESLNKKFDATSRKLKEL